MDLQQLAMIGLSCATGALGWFARELWGAVQKLKEDLSKLEIRIGTDYVRYDRLQDALKPIAAQLDRIEETLQTKQDKD